MVDVLRLHVGLPKCGSTTLQTAFTETKNTLFLGKPFPEPDILYFTRRVAPFYDVRLIDSGKYRTAFEKAFAATPHAHALLSDEILSSVGFAACGGGLSLVQIIENYKRLLDVRIEVVVVVREQVRFLKSYFRHMTIVGGDLDYSEFISLMLLRHESWLYPVLDYELLHRRLSYVADDVVMVPFERLFSDADYAKSVLERLNVEDAFDVFSKTHDRSSSSEAKIAALIGVNRKVPIKQNVGWFRRFNWPEQRYLQTKDPAVQLLRQKMSRLLKAQKTTLAKWAEAREKAPAASGKELYHLDPKVERLLMSYIGTANRRLSDTISATDWSALGYHL